MFTKRQENVFKHYVQVLMERTSTDFFANFFNKVYGGLPPYTLFFKKSRVKINTEQSIVGDVSILMGDTKSFKHHLLNHENNFIKLPFKLRRNKIAIVEQETRTDYIAMQYLIEKDWNLEVTKCEDQEAGKTWNLKQKLADGQLRDLVGVRKIYYDKNSKHPKIF